MTKIYTRTGDDGETGLFGGPRVRKNDPRIEAFGAVDELNAMIGWARAASLPADIEPTLRKIQCELFDLGAELAAPQASDFGLDVIGPTHVAFLEAEIDRHEARLEPLKRFILPAGSEGAVRLHVARTVARRAERAVVTLDAATPQRSGVVHYLNRLSDLLFVLARSVNHSAGLKDEPWERSAK